jgi:two-component system sensor histidine kinase/response regulator
MTPEQCQSLFNLYTQVNQPQQTLGLGLGLYICRQIITAHGGEIGVDSEPNVGSQFWFTLPTA